MGSFLQKQAESLHQVYPTVYNVEWVYCVGVPSFNMHIPHNLLFSIWLILRPSGFIHKGINLPSSPGSQQDAVVQLRKKIYESKKPSTDIQQFLQLPHIHMQNYLCFQSWSCLGLWAYPCRLEVQVSPVFYVKKLQSTYSLASKILSQNLLFMLLLP